MKSPYEVWGDNLIEIDWFTSLHPSLGHSRRSTISNRGSNVPEIDDLIRYDRPDIILLRDNKPVLVIEKTREVPTGHNVGQRMARLVRAAESSVPVIKYFPFDALKHGRYASMCHMNARLLAAFASMQRIHNVPVLAVNWPHDADGELVTDGSEDDQIRSLLLDFFQNDCAKHWPAAHAINESMLHEYKTRVSEHAAYSSLPPSVQIVRTRSLAQHTGLSGASSEWKRLEAVANSVVYAIGMTEDKCRREDPFTGSQFIYDYLECRNGPRVENKSKNLVLWFPHVSKRRFIEANPNDPSRKSSNWYLTANAMAFSDQVMILRECQS